MKKPKFTPGPWKAGKNPFTTTILDGHEGKAIYPKESNYHIAWANAENSNGDLDIETALANARLIAAAPELYDALEKMVNNTCRRSCSERHPCKTPCYVVKDAVELLREVSGAK